MASPKIKLLICLTTLSLLLGCVPTFITPTPIPPLDPNAIRTFMVQTANAAATQTVAAMPPATLTPTFTSTPRNTFTPEPSFTPVGTFAYPTPSPIMRLQYYRLKHDSQLAMYDFKSRTEDENTEGVRRQAPEIVPLFLAPKLSAGTGRTNMSGAWERYMYDLNDNDEKKLVYLKGKTAGLFNTSGFPQMESLTMGGNIITLAKIEGDWGQVVTLPYGGPPSAAEVNYITRPDLVHKFVVVTWRRATKTTGWVNPPKGSIHYPLVSGRSVWVQMERLEPFPILPMDVKANIDLNIQPTPGPKIEESRKKLTKGESITLIQYYPSGSTVWAQVQVPGGTGWIPLIVKGQFSTTWTMATAPPPY